MATIKFKVIPESLNARVKPSIKAKVGVVLKQGQVINVVRGSAKVAEGIKWYKAVINKKNYWVSGKYLQRITPRYRTLVAEKAKMVYAEVIKLGCKHTGGAKTFEQMKAKKITTCETSVSVSLQLAGVLKKGTIVGHTKKVGSSAAKKKKNKISKAIRGTKNLIPGTYKIVKIGKVYKKMPAKYKKPGNVLVYDSNIAIIRDANSVYSTNNGASQKKNGKYINDIAKSGYNFTSPVLYCINIYD